MAFVLDYRPAAQSFLDGLNLDRDGRLRLFRTLQGLRRVSDGERTDPANRLGPFFVFRRAFRDKGRLLRLRLVVDDAPAVHGVLRVVYADLT